MPNIIKPLGGLTTSAQLAAALSDETGTGLAVFSDSPAFTTQISTPKIVTASGNLEILPPGSADIVLQRSGTGKVGIGQTTPTAVLHLRAGTATANTAPLKFTSGSLLTTTEAGAIEFLTDAFYATITTGAGTAAARKTIAFLESPAVFTTLSATGSINGNIASGIRAFAISGWTLAGFSGNTLQIGNTQNGGEWTEIAHYIGATKITSTTGAGLAVTGGLSATTQISTPKIVTASGGLEITPAGNDNVIVGNGVAGNNQIVQFIGGTNAGRGVGIQFLRGVTAFFSIFNEAFVLGSGASSTPCFLANTGLGMKFMVDGSTVASVEISSGGNVGIGTATPTARLHLPAGTTVANTAPLQFTSGPPETTPRAGLVEYDGVLTFTAADALRTPLNKQYVLASKIGANFNVTTDQSITLPAGRWVIRKIVVNNASVSLTTAAGGVYTGASKTGTTIVGAAQVYSALTASGKYLDLTLDAAMATDILTATTIYFSLTTAQGAAATGDIFIIGDRLDY